MAYPADCFEGGMVDGAWYDAQALSSFRRDGVTLTAYGQAFDEWRDKSGNGRHLLQGTSDPNNDCSARDDGTYKYASMWHTTGSEYRNVGGGGGSGGFYFCAAIGGASYDGHLFTDVSSLNVNSGFLVKYSGDGLTGNGAGAYIFSVGNANGTGRVQVGITVGVAGDYKTDLTKRLIECWWTPSAGVCMRINKGTVVTAALSSMTAGSSSLTFKLYANGMAARCYGVVYTRNAAPSEAGRDATATAVAAYGGIAVAGGGGSTGGGNFPADAFAGGVDGVWYDAQSIASFKRDTVAISGYGEFFDEWLDKSGNAHHLTQSGATMDGIAYDHSGVPGRNYKSGWLWEGMSAQAGAGASTGFYLAMAWDGGNEYTITLFSDHTTNYNGFRLEYVGEGVTGSNGPVYRFSAGTGAARTLVWVNADLPKYTNDDGIKLIECWWSATHGLNIRKNKGPVQTQALSSMSAGQAGFKLPLYHFTGHLIAYLHTKNSVPNTAGRDAIADQFLLMAGLASPDSTGLLTGSVHGREMSVADFVAINAAVPRLGTMAAVEVAQDAVVIWQTDRSVRTGTMAAVEGENDRFVAGGPGMYVPPSADFLAWLAWLASPDRIKCVLVEVEVNNGQWRYLSSTGYTSRPEDTPASQNYLGVVNGGATISERLSLDGEAAMSFGDVEIANTDGALDAWLDDVWPGRVCRIYVGDHRWARSKFQLIFNGVVSALTSRSRNVLNLIVRDKLQRLNTALTQTQVGGTWANADRLVPLSFGEVSNVSPVLIHDAQLIYQVHNGPVERIIEVRDNGVPVNFVADPANGKFRLTASPVGGITASVQGDKGASMGYVNTAARMVRRIATGYGVDSFLQVSDLDESKLAHFDNFNPQPLGVYLSDRENVLSVCQALAASVGAQLVMPATGKLRLVKIALPAVGHTTAVGTGQMVARSLSIAERTTVQAAIRLGYCRNWTPQPGLETGIPSEHKDLFAQEWFIARAVDASVASTYRLTGEPAQVDTCLLAKVDAEAEAQRRLALWKVQRTVFRYVGTAELFNEELGGYQTLTHPRFGLAGGKTGQIISIERDWLAGRVTIEVLI